MRKVIRSAVEIKAWLLATPSVDAVRPRSCMGCETASCPVGEPLRVHGQGLIRRQIRGPLCVDGEPELVTISARKYECQACGAVMTVVPSGVLPGRQYSAPAIALALWLFVLDALSGVVVRQQVSPWQPARPGRRRGWAQLYRWVRDVRKLFRPTRPLPEADQAQVVRRTLFALIAMAPPGLEVPSGVARAFASASSLR